MEIGSEFWLESNEKNSSNNKNECQIGKDRKLLLSGRTAIDYILEEILLKRKISKIYFPNYCCQSMIDPFVKKNIDIVFYSVSFDNGIKYEINEKEQCDIFFAMSYFGYVDSNMDYYIKKFKEKGSIIVEDSTHSLLSSRPYSKDSNYIVASLRKWFPIISGAIAINNNEFFNSQINLSSENKKMVQTREEAMKMKKAFIEGKQIDKTEFLGLYKKANEYLNENYQKIEIDNKSRKILEDLSIDEIIKKRKENAMVIYEKLDNKEINFMFENLSEKDTPLFIPIILKNEEIRNKFRNYLISKNIYCPIHWPIPEIFYS